MTAVRLSDAHQRWVYAVGALVALSGMLWLLFHWFVSVPGEFGPTAHPLERWWLRLHGLSAAAFLIVFGAVLPLHAKLAWNARRNRWSGSLFVSALALLIGTGYALYYLGDDTVRNALSIAHWVVGLVAPALIAFHAWRGRLSRQAPSRLARDQDRA